MSDRAPTDARAEAPDSPLSRRAALAAGGVATASAALLAVACSTYPPSKGNSAAAPNDAASPPVAPAADGAPNAAPGGAGAAPAGGIPLGPASSIPVGGGRVFANQNVVVTQPTAGQFKAFSAICPHKGCTVNKVSDGTIDCPCHDSKFSITDGSVQDGPADEPLPAKSVSAAGGTLRLT